MRGYNSVEIMNWVRYVTPLASSRMKQLILLCAYVDDIHKKHVVQTSVQQPQPFSELARANSDLDALLSSGGYAQNPTKQETVRVFCGVGSKSQ